MLIQRGRPWYQWREEILEILQDLGFMEYFHWGLEQIKDSKKEENYLDRMKLVALMAGMGQAQRKN